MKEQFTPRPIITVRKENGFRYYFLENKKGAESIEEASANRILWEAAPEMYEALKKAYDTLYPLIENPISGELMDEIYAALPKANPQK